MPLNAHDFWANGMKVPDWVKSACCGPSDAHILDPEDVEEVNCPAGLSYENTNGEGCHRIRGINFIIPPSKTFESQDGQLWAFYPTKEDGSPFPDAVVYCLFMNRSF
jgi:hypothetical protein